MDVEIARQDGTRGETNTTAGVEALEWKLWSGSSVIVINGGSKSM